MKTSLRLALNIVLFIFIVSGIYLANATIRRFGLALLIITAGTFLFNFIKQKRLALPYYFAGFLAASFILFKAFSFLNYAKKESDKFEIPTAVVFETVDFSSALSKAKTEDKYIFIYFYATWCGPCLKFTKTILTDEEVGKSLNNTFINLKYNAEKGEGKIVAQRYKVKGFPTLMVLDSEGEIIERLATATIPTKGDIIKLSDKYKK